MQTDRIITLDLSPISRLKLCNNHYTSLILVYFETNVIFQKVPRPSCKSSHCLRNVISSKSIRLYWLICYFSELLYLVGQNINLCRPLLNLDKKRKLILETSPAAWHSFQTRFRDHQDNTEGRTLLLFISDICERQLKALTLTNCLYS